MKINRKQSRGFTLVELMVVLVILGIISVGTITAITSQNKVYHSEEDLIDMQMNARIAMDRICFLLRMAGVGCSDSFGNKLTSGDPALATFNNTTEVYDVAEDDDVELVYNDGTDDDELKQMFLIENHDSPIPDKLTLVGAVKYAGNITGVATTKITMNSKDHEIEGGSGAKSYIFISPSDNNEYRIIKTASNSSKDLIPVVNLKTPETTEIDNAINATNPIQIDVYRVQAFTIRLVEVDQLRTLRIDNNISGTSSQLDVADNIQDLQFRYGLDTNDDNQIDNWVDDTGDLDQIRAIRVFILARTGKIDKEYTDRKKYTLAGLEVGPFTGTDSTDLDTYKHVHRYLLESTITIRNWNF